MTNDLSKKAKELRRNVLKLASETGEAHIGGSFSQIEILVSLYDEVLKDQDKFILSKGHAYAPLYLLLKEKGYNPHFSGHPDIDVENGICCTTGSLGHGLPIGTGMAFARKLKGQKGRIYVLMSDGECQEGTTWEASDIASQYKLSNLITIVDYNEIQALSRVEDVSPANFMNKFNAFGWYVDEVDGHNFQQLISTLKKEVEKPHMIIAHTTKGKGVSYMENDSSWHAKPPTEEQLKQAYEELR